MSEWIAMQPGVQRRTLEAGAHLMLMEVRLDAGSHLPEHAHDNEQLSYVVSGRLALTLDGEVYEYGAGESVVIKGGVRHSADARADTVVLDTFSPPRTDLLAQDAQMKQKESSNA